MELSVVFSFSEVLPGMASWTRGWETSHWNLYQELNTRKLWQQSTGFNRIFLGRQLYQRAKMFWYFKDLLSPSSWCCEGFQGIWSTGWVQ